MIVDHKTIQGWHPYLIIFIVMMRKISANISGDPEMTHCIHVIWRQSNFKNIILVRVKEGCGRQTNPGFFVQYHNACMTVSQPNFIFSADHSLTFDTSDFSNFDRDGITLGRENSRPNGRNNYFLSDVDIES